MIIREFTVRSRNFIEVLKHVNELLVIKKIPKVAHPPQTTSILMSLLLKKFCLINILVMCFLDNVFASKIIHKSN